VLQCTAIEQVYALFEAAKTSVIDEHEFVPTVRAIALPRCVCVCEREREREERTHSYTRAPGRPHSFSRPLRS
jgi:hypothetical protein